MIIVGGFLFVVAFELFVHWYMSKGYTFSSGLLQWYISQSPVSHKGVNRLLDTMLPNAVLGILIGWLGWRWSLEKIALLVVLVAIGIAALQPAYTLFLNRDLLWWLPGTTGGLVGYILWEGVFGIVEVGVFTYGGRRFGEYYSHPKT
jgi:hypothetical protein